MNNQEKLVKMANQIGAFFSSMPDREEGIDGVATHLKKFWTPSMRKDFFRALDAQEITGLSEIVMAAALKHRENLLAGL